MSCQKIQKRLPLYSSDDLSLRQKSEVEAHLQRCLGCYRESLEYREDSSLLAAMASTEREAQPSPLGEQFSREVMAQIDGPPPMPRLLPRLVSMSGWAAALMLGAFLLWGSGDGRVDQTPDPLVPGTTVGNQGLENAGERPASPLRLVREGGELDEEQTPLTVEELLRDEWTRERRKPFSGAVPVNYVPVNGRSDF